MPVARFASCSLERIQPFHVLSLSDSPDTLEYLNFITQATPIPLRPIPLRPVPLRPVPLRPKGVLVCGAVRLALCTT